MKNIKINFKNITDKQINSIVSYLKQGKVMAYPTDTIYGLGCLATDRKAIRKVHRIKNQEIKKASPPKADQPLAENQETKKPLLVLISDYKMLTEYCYVNVEQKEYLKKIWPGPVTVVLKLKKKMPIELTGGLKSLAVRLPKSRFLIKIIKKLGKPIVSTSLNLVGKPLLITVRNLDRHFKKEKPDLVIDGGVLKGRPSKLVDVRDVNNIKILRK